MSFIKYKIFIDDSSLDGNLSFHLITAEGMFRIQQGELVKLENDKYENIKNGDFSEVR